MNDVVNKEEQEVLENQEVKDIKQEDVKTDVKTNKDSEVRKTKFSTPYNGQLEIIDTYKSMVNDTLEYIKTIDKEMINMAKQMEDSIKELDSAVKATQIYEKLFTNIVIGFAVIILGLIAVLFIVK